MSSALYFKIFILDIGFALTATPHLPRVLRTVFDSAFLLTDSVDRIPKTFGTINVLELLRQFGELYADKIRYTRPTLFWKCLAFIQVETVGSKNFLYIIILI